MPSQELYFLPPDLRSDAGASDARPLARRALRTARPVFVAMRALKPDFRRRFLHSTYRGYRW
jgi:hypothetical protein